MDIKQVYIDSKALLEGHFLLSSGKHSPYYLQSARIMEYPQKSEIIIKELSKLILDSGIKIDSVCSPALGGLLVGYELARALNVRFIFTERVNGKMELRRGFSVREGEKILICEDIITTGGSAVECGNEVSQYGAEVVAYAALANRGICSIYNDKNPQQDSCKLNPNIPLFALGNFVFDTYETDDCPLCKEGSVAIKPGSRGN